MPQQEGTSVEWVGMSMSWITAVGPWHLALVAIVLIILQVFFPWCCSASSVS